MHFGSILDDCNSVLAAQALLQILLRSDIDT